MWKYSVALVLAAAAFAQSPKYGVGRAASPEEIRGVGAIIAPDGTGLPEGSGTVAAGREVFAANCARCHGGDLKGTTQGPPFLHAVYAPGHHGDAAFAVAVKSGVRPHHWNFGPMPSIPGLDDRQIALIVAFVRAEQEAVGVR